MLPYAVWAYRHSSRLFVHGFPEGTPPISLERGVRQGDACAAYYFALTEQDVLEAIALTHPATSPVAYADDGYVQGSPASVIAAFLAICRLGASIGLTARLDKCGVYSPNAIVGAQVAAALGIPQRPTHSFTIIRTNIPEIFEPRAFVSINYFITFRMYGTIAYNFSYVKTEFTKTGNLKATSEKRKATNTILFDIPHQQGHFY